MTYSHIKQPVLLLVTFLVGIGSYLNNSQAALPQQISIGHATHGLQVYVDPDTGQFGRPPPEQATDLSGSSFSAQAATKKLASITLSEQASAKAGGGYTIELRERYRPSRHGSR